MATTVMSSMSSLAFAASGARAGFVAPVYRLAPLVRFVCVSLILNTFPQF
jgi:hypothetical protein